MLSNIINQIQNERAQDRVLSNQIGTNKRHDHIRNIPGHRKVGQNSFFSMVKLTPAPAPEPTPIEIQSTVSE